MFDDQRFPYEYECKACGKTATVEHGDVQDVPSHLRASKVTEAVEYVITSQKAWSINPTGPLCPSCVDG